MERGADRPSESAPPLTRFGIGAKITLLLCAVAGLSAMTVGAITDWQFYRALVNQELKELTVLAEVKAVRFEADMESLKTDALFVAHAPVVQRLARARQSGGVDPVSQETEEQLLDRMAIFFKHLLQAKPSYCQARLIGIADGGREIARVDRAPRGELRVASEAELQKKGHEPYFDAALRLADGEVYLSEINLNREHGQVVDPPMPVVRAASPVFGMDGKPAAFLIINRLFLPMVDELRKGLGEGNTLLVVNERGDYLIHPDPQRTFGFDRGIPLRMQDDYAGLAPFIESSDQPSASASIVDDSPTGERTAFGLFRAPFVPEQPDHFVTVMLAASYDAAVAESVRSRHRSMLAGAVVIMIALAAGYFISRSVTKPLRQITWAAEAFGRGNPNIELPIAARDETGVLARSLNDMMAQIQRARWRLEKRNLELEESRAAALNLLQDIEAARAKLSISEHLAQEKSARIQAILDGATDAIITIGVDGLIESFNGAAERMFGYTAAEVFGKNVKMLMPQPYHDQHNQYLRNYVETGVAKIIGIGREVTGIRSDGTTFPLELAVSEVALGDRRIFTGIVRDVSKLKRAMQQLSVAHLELAERAAQIERYNANLSRSNEELKQFAYVASHDLQEPLRKVTAFCQMLEVEYADRLDDDARQYIQYAVEGAQRMKGLISDLLSYSRVETQGKPLEPTDAGEACADAIENLSAAIEESGAEISCEPLPVINADRAQLVRLFQNLIGNAIKYRGVEPPRISIRAEERPEACVFRVRDNGIGIEPQYFERVFVIFQRLHARDEYSGTGIGLAVCKRIVERAGGKIWIESEAGSGSEFCFTMPKVAFAAQTSQEGSTTHDGTPQKVVSTTH